MSLFENLPPEEVVYLSSQKIKHELKNSTPQQKKSLDFKKISGIKKAAPEIQKYIEDIDTNETPDDDIVVGGSSAAYTQVKKHRKPKDLDIYTPYLDKEVRNISSILRRRYGIQNVIVGQKFITEMDGKDVEVIQIKIRNKKGELVDAVDIKREKDTGIISILKHPKLMIGKVYFEPVDYLIHRKAVAIEKNYYRKIKEGKLPRARVKKDIKDFKVLVSSVPDYKKKNLKPYMSEFEKNLNFGVIPEKDAASVLSSLDMISGIGDPFGSSIFTKNKSDRFLMWRL